MLSEDFKISFHTPSTTVTMITFQIVMCVSSLKRLCLVRVHELDFPTDSLQELPDTLLRELAKARLFCGNYLGQTGRYGVDSAVMSQTCLSIRYDWIRWTFVFRSQSIIIPCCYNCDYIQPVVYTLSPSRNMSPAHSSLHSPGQRVKWLWKVRETLPTSGYRWKWMKMHGRVSSPSMEQVEEECSSPAD